MHTLDFSLLDSEDGEPTREDYLEAGEAAGFYFAGEAFTRFSAKLIPGLGGITLNEREKAELAELGRGIGGILFDDGLPFTLRTFSEVMARLTDPT